MSTGTTPADSRPILILQQVQCEGPGTLSEILSELRIPSDVRRLHVGHEVPASLDGYRGLFVLGGPMNVGDAEPAYLGDEVALLEKAIAADLPTLGICLGAQLLAKAAGAEVRKGPRPEIGWGDITLTEHGLKDRAFEKLPTTSTAFHWHFQTFDLPEGAALLASSEQYPNQIFRLGKSVYGLQCHLEVTEWMIRDWCRRYEGDLAPVDGFEGYEDADAAAEALCGDIVGIIYPLRNRLRDVVRAFLGAPPYPVISGA